MIIKIIKPRIFPGILRTFSRSNTSKAGDIQGIPEYFNYCSLNRVDAQSTVFRGTLYELYAKDILEKAFYFKSLIKAGGPGDDGLDLIGKWDLSYFYNKSLKLFPNSVVSKQSVIHYSKENDQSQNDNVSLKDDINVLIQCKNFKAKLKPGDIKELAGIYHHHRADPRTTFMVLVTPQLLTKQGLKSFEGAMFPMMCVHISSPSNVSGNPYNLDDYTGGEYLGMHLNKVALEFLSGLHVEDLLGKRRI
ncbi:Required for respiratory growth protein 7 mitochondrial [Spathaspora sp. JA1]|nr:Required for respiratory growth protein 7 mitochondrial [Spathaspora sp. JA1]